MKKTSSINLYLRKMLDRKHSIFYTAYSWVTFSRGQRRGGPNSLQHHTQKDTQMQTFTFTHANLMIENMRIGMALYDVQEFRLLAVNNRFKLFLEEYLCPGKSYEIAIGCPLKTLLPQPKEVAKAILNIFHAVVETGEPYEIDNFPIPMVGKGLTYWQWTLDPIRDASGTITHLLHSANDVTEHVRVI